MLKRSPEGEGVFPSHRRDINQQVVDKQSNFKVKEIKSLHNYTNNK